MASFGTPVLKRDLTTIPFAVAHHPQHHTITTLQNHLHTSRDEETGRAVTVLTRPRFNVPEGCPQASLPHFNYLTSGSCGATNIDKGRQDHIFLLHFCCFSLSVICQLIHSSLKLTSSTLFRAGEAGQVTITPTSSHSFQTSLAKR